MNVLPLLFPAVLLASASAEELREFKTPSGLRVILEERHERPLLRLELRVAWETRDLPGGRECAGELVCAILDRCGAGGLSRVALERSLGDRGLRLNFEGRRRSLAWSMLADSQDQEDAFQFLAHAVFRPTLIEGIQATQREGKREVSPEDGYKASLGFPVEGVTLCPLELSELVALHRRLVRPERSVLVIQGDLSLAQARQLVSLHLGTWAPSPEPGPGEVQVPPRFPECLRVSGGTPLAMAGSPAPEGEARVRAAHVLLGICLEQTLRSASEANITLEAPRLEGDAGPLLFRTQPEASGDPERLLKAGLEHLLSTGLSASDLAQARNQWRAERVALALHPEDQVSTRAGEALRGDPGVFLEEIRLEEVNEALRHRLSPKSLQWFVRGPR